MTRTRIYLAAAATLAVLASTGTSFAWTKDFAGSRADVRAACLGEGKLLVEGSTYSSCHNTLTKITVDCTDAGDCTGSGRAMFAPVTLTVELVKRMPMTLEASATPAQPVVIE
jgi:hypothetical protein